MIENIKIIKISRVLSQNTRLKSLILVNLN
jgi:hypothetical protein